MSTALQAVGGFVLVLAPGTLLVIALFGNRGPRGSERLALMLASSLSIVVGAGLLLDLTSGGMTARSWPLALLGCSAVLAVASLPRLARAGIPRIRRLRMRDAAALTLAVALAVLAVGIARSGAASAQRRHSFAQLWLLPDAHRAGTVKVGVDSFGPRSRRFRLSVTRANGRPLATIDDLRLPPQHSVSREVVVPPSTRTVVARLFRQGDVKPYRTVRLWLVTP